MSSEPIVVEVDSGISDLLPIFFEQRKEDQSALAAAIAAKDLLAVRHVAHGMAGAGTSYGFARITQLGEALVEAGREGNFEMVVRLKAEFDGYLARVVVKYL